MSNLEAYIEDVIPLGERILVKKLVRAEKITKTGLLIVSKVPKKENVGLVEKIGEGLKDLAYKIGDIVLLDGYAGQPIDIGDEEFALVHGKEDVMAIIKYKE